MLDFSEIQVDFCSLFDGVFRLRFICSDFSATFDYSSSLWSHITLPAIKCERIDTFVASYRALHPHPLTDDVFWLDLPTAFGYLSSHGKWLTTGTHHARVFFDYHALFES